MFAYLRRIRRKLLSSGSIRKYLIYALGEVLLVKVGILLALQVNNWNSDRIEQTKVKNYAFALEQDLEKK